MCLTPRELDRLTIFTAAELARRWRVKGWKLTYPEALALICDEMHEAACRGASYEDVLHVGQSALSADDVLEGGGEEIQKPFCAAALAARLRWRPPLEKAVC